MTEQRFFSLNDLARFLGMSRATLYEWAEARKIPAYKLGRVWRFDKGEIEKFLETCRRNAIV